MGIRISAIKTQTHTYTMKLQISLILAVAAMAVMGQKSEAPEASINRVQQAKGFANAQKKNVAAGIKDAQAFLDQHNIEFNVQEQVNKMVQAANLQGKANGLKNDAQKKLNQALKQIPNDKFRQPITNIIKQIQKEIEKKVSA